MTHEQFNGVVQSAFKQCTTVMSNKNSDYAPGNDKLANFKQAARIAGVPPEIALFGMDLKHYCSIQTGIAEFAAGKYRPLNWWTEKIVDHINYMYLLLGLLTERCESAEKQITPDGRRGCDNCMRFGLPSNDPLCICCCGSNDHPNWIAKMCSDTK